MGKRMGNKKYVLSAQKVIELEAELKTLETEGRQKISDSLDWLRSLPNDQEDTTFSEIFDDQRFLEKRISEIKDILSDYQELDESKKVNKVSLGSVVRVGFGDIEDEYIIVSELEADPLQNKISNESPVGKALMDKKVGDVVIVDVGLLTKEYRILEIK